MKMINQTHIEGLLYEHSLEAKVSGPNSKNPGTNFINGDIKIATDDDCLNIISVHFSYVTPTFGSSGKTNPAFAILKNIIDGTYHNVMAHGKENALRLNVDSAIGLNEFYSDRNGQEELVSAKRNEGGFIHVLSGLNEDEKTRNTFKCDMIITNVRRVEGDPEKNTSDKVIVKGYTFDFRKALLPVEFSAINTGAMNYFENLGVTSKTPVFTQVWGRQISETTVKKYVEESAFGENLVREVPSSHKDFIITGARRETYDWDDESTITVAQFQEALANRETYLATVKQRQDDYRASKGQVSAITSTPNEVPATGAFQF